MVTHEPLLMAPVAALPMLGSVISLSGYLRMKDSYLLLSAYCVLGG